MTTSRKPANELAFKAPNSNWRKLGTSKGVESREGKDQQAREQEVQSSKEDFKNALLSSLQMQHVVVLAGSGCSLDVGGPSMCDLWDAVIGKKPTKKATGIAEKIHYSFGDPNSNNIEAFLSQVEAFLQFEDDNDVSAFLMGAKKKILTICSSFLGSSKLDAHQTFLHRLSRRRARDQRLRIFTTNYDLCFERAASEMGGVAIDGFSFTATRRYDPRFFGYDIIRRSRGAENGGNYLVSFR